MPRFCSLSLLSDLVMAHACTHRQKMRVFENGSQPLGRACGACDPHTGISDQLEYPQDFRHLCRLRLPPSVAHTATSSRYLDSATIAFLVRV